MKLIKLREIVNEQAFRLKEGAGYSGANNDGGSANLLMKLKDYEYSLIVKMDLRPSEYSILDDVEVEEPREFQNIIEDYKLKLAMEIVKQIKL